MKPKSWYMREFRGKREGEAPAEPKITGGFRLCGWAGASPSPKLITLGQVGVESNTELVSLC